MLSKLGISLNLRSRILLSMLAVLLLAFIVTGVTAYYYYKNQNEDYHRQRLERKEKAVEASMEYFLRQQGGFIAPDAVPAVFTDKICELSDIHNLPILLYDLKGNLQITSNPLLIEQKDIPIALDEAIFEQLQSGQSRAVVDRNGTVDEYLLAYWYFTDEADKPIAIVNVPYFDTSEVNREELDTFLIKLSQIYVVLFIVSGMLAYFLANYITRPLKEITTRMQSVDLSIKNEELHWNSQDEIGALIKEYNLMVKEVERSAGLLAKSERESAWREMAKQVAHEIKNPLTPMKLRIQHLMRSWQDSPEDFDEKLKRTSHSLIEQIDTLTNIANEFSNFAKMPKAQREQLDLTSTITSAIDTHAQNTEGVELHFDNQVKGSALVYADKNQALRVFNNVIKNAIQSIPEGKQGEIRIRLKPYNEMFMAEIEDNGSGIADSEKDKIFVPNFTTKSTGMGLGLAMVSDIMKGNQGDIWFQSSPGEGSTFFVTFPKLSQGE